jgi:hypothetical protein
LKVFAAVLALAKPTTENEKLTLNRNENDSTSLINPKEKSKLLFSAAERFKNINLNPPSKTLPSA